MENRHMVSAVSRRPSVPAARSWGAAVAVLLLAGPAAAQDVRARDADARGFVVPAGSVSVNPAAPAQPSRVPGAYALGIMARNTPAGVEVVSAQPGSVALASGIQPGDVIVTVAGYQVGNVGDRLYDVTDEITRRVNAAGQVPLLVRNGRTGALAPLVVQYGARSRCTITGVLTTDATGPLPPTAVVTVRLIDVTRPEWQDVAITQGQLPPPLMFPTTYRLDLPPLPADRRYAIEARVDDRGRLLMKTNAPIALAAVDRDQRIDAFVTARGIPAPTGPTGLMPRDQITQWFQSYLGRQPRPYEVDIWLADLQRGRTLRDVQAGILSSTEMFERTRANRDLYVAEVFRLLYGVPPTPVQMRDLQQRYDGAQGIRLTFVEQLLQQPR